MWTRQHLRGGAPTGYALGWGLSDERGLHIVEHSGAQQGVSTHLAILPDRNLAVVVLMNLESGGARKLALEILFALAPPNQAR
jgi:CubicO group peptidase (beta-lactamase class C family)